MKRFELNLNQKCCSNENVSATHATNIANDCEPENRTVANEGQADGRTVANASQADGRTVAIAGQADERTVAIAGQADERTVAIAGQADERTVANASQADGRTVAIAGQADERTVANVTKISDDVKAADNNLQNQDKDKKFAFGSANIIQAEGHVPQQVNTSKDINRSFDDAQAEMQDSLSFTFDFHDETFWKILDIVAKSAKNEKLVPEMRTLKNVSEDPNLGECITYPSMHLRINLDSKLQNAVSLSKEAVRDVAKSKESEQMCTIKEPQEDTTKQQAATPSELEAKFDDSILYLKNYETNKEGIKYLTDSNSVADGIDKVAHSPQNLTKEKDGNESTIEVAATGNSLQKVEDKYEGQLSEPENNTKLQIKLTGDELENESSEVSADSSEEESDEDFDKYLKDSKRFVEGVQNMFQWLQKRAIKNFIKKHAFCNKDGSNDDNEEITLHDGKPDDSLDAISKIEEIIEKHDNYHRNKLDNLEHNTMPSDEFHLKLNEFLTSQDFNLDERKEEGILEATLELSKERDLFSSEKDITNSDNLEETRESKEQRDTILGLDHKVKIEKDFGSPLDCKKKPVRSSQKLTEDKKDKQNEVNEESHCDKDKLKSVEETRAWLKKSSERTKNILVDEFEGDLQNTKLDGNDNKPRDLESEIKSFIEDRDYRFSEKEPVTSASKAEVHENRIAAEFEGENNAIIAVSKKQKHTYAGLKGQTINFEFEINGCKRITKGYQKFLPNENEALIFNNEAGTISVYFIDDKIFVDTQNSKFEISVQNPSSN